MRTRQVVVVLSILALALRALMGMTLFAGGGAAPPAAVAPITGQDSEAIDLGAWHQENIALTADAAGNLYAAWADYRNANIPHIRFAYRSAVGAWTASIRVDATGAGSQILPSIAVDGAGTVYLTWQDFRGGADLSQIRFAYRPAGGAWGASQVISPTTQAQIQPALAVNSSGAAVVAWVQRAAQQKPLDIYVATRPAGGVWSAGIAPLPAVTSSRTDPHTGLDDAGRAYLVWTEAGRNWPDVYFAMRPVGSAWSAAEKVNDAATNAWWAVARLAAPRDGRGPVHAIWMDNRSGSQDIYHATRPLAGAWSANVKVNDDSGATAQWTPSLALDAAGNATAAWVDQRNGRWDLYRADRPAGGAWGANTLLVAGPPAGAPVLLAPRLTGCTSNPVTAGAHTGYSQGNTADQCARHNVYVTVQQPAPTRTPTAEPTHTATPEPTRTPTPTATPIPPVQAWVDENGVLHIRLYGDADAKVTVKDGNVLVNGQPVGDPPAKAADIKGIDVQGGSGSNDIDLRGVTRADFTSLGDGKVYVAAGDGWDWVYGSAFGDVIDGGADDDCIWGEAGNDALIGGDGQDRLYGGSGDDALEGGKGADELTGDDGNDALVGGDGDDNLFGDEGSDTLNGGEGADELFGGGGDDALYGGGGRDILDGSTGNDVLYGGMGDDALFGGEGDDIIISGFGNDFVYGGFGNDVYQTAPGSADTLTDDGGDDTVDFSEATAGIILDLDLKNVDQAVDAAGNTIRLEGQFEDFIGSRFDDVVFVDALTVTRHLDSGPDAAGDTLNFDPHGAWVADDSRTITAAGYAPVTYTGFETVLGTRPCSNLTPGDSWAQTFMVPGNYSYFDARAPGHTGRVVVGAVGQVANLSYTAAITITEAGFDPAEVTITISDTVRWTNRGAGVHAVAGGEPTRIYLPLVAR